MFDTPPTDVVARPDREIGVVSRARIPTRHTCTSMIGLGPIPASQIINVHNLVDEANRSQVPRDGDHLTHNEDAVRSRAVKTAQRDLDRAVTKVIEPMIKAVKPLHAEINILDKQHGLFANSLMRGPNGEALTPDENRSAHDKLAEKITQDFNDNSKKHYAHAPSKLKEIGLLLLDYPVFLYAMLSLLNVNVRLIGVETGVTVKAAIAAVFALLGTGMLAVVARSTGRRHRDFKGDSGTIETDPRNRRRTRLELGAFGVVVICAAAVMASRVIIDGLEAEVMPALMYTLAALFGLLVAFATYINYNAEYDNGSRDTDRLQHHSVQQRQRAAVLEDIEGARAVRIEEAGIRIAKLHRAIVKARTDAEHQVSRSRQDRALKLARSYHGLTGSATNLPAPGLDFTRLELAAEQATQLADHQRMLAAGSIEQE